MTLSQCSSFVAVIHLFRDLLPPVVVPSSLQTEHPVGKSAQMPDVDRFSCRRIHGANCNIEKGLGSQTRCVPRHARRLINVCHMSSTGCGRRHWKRPPTSSNMSRAGVEGHCATQGSRETPKLPEETGRFMFCAHTPTTCSRTIGMGSNKRASGRDANGFRVSKWAGKTKFIEIDRENTVFRNQPFLR